MSGIGLAYLFSLAMTAGLVWLAWRNRKSGWRRERPETWIHVKPLEAAGPPIGAVPVRFTQTSASATPPPADFRQELGNLGLALASYSAGPGVAAPAPVAPAVTATATASEREEEKAVRPL